MTTSDHSSALDAGFPGDYSAFQAARTRFLDRLHVDSILWQAARDARRAEGEEKRAMGTCTTIERAPEA